MISPERKFAELGLKPGKGQNFLNHEPTVEALVAAGEVEGKNTLEIGGGLGAITQKLTGKTSQLTVYENDTKLANYLSSEFSEVNVVDQDVLEADISEYERCVSNIPFQISSEIIELLGEAQLQSALIVQDDLADKITADPGNKKHGFFTVKAQYYFLPVKLRTVDARCFSPRPEVDAAIIKLYPNKERHNIENEEEFFSFVKALHTHGKKKTRNAFVDARNMLDISKSEAKEIRENLPYTEERVRELGITELKECFEYFHKKKD